MADHDYDSDDSGYFEQSEASFQHDTNPFATYPEYDCLAKLRVVRDCRMLNDFVDMPNWPIIDLNDVFNLLPYIAILDH